MSIEEIQNEVAKELHGLSFNNAIYKTDIGTKLIPLGVMKEVCKRYAIECSKTTLNKAAHKMECSIEDNGYTGTRLLRSAITDESNITLL